MLAALVCQIIGVFIHLIKKLYKKLTQKSNPIEEDSNELEQKQSDDITFSSLLE